MLGSNFDQRISLFQEVWDTRVSLKENMTKMGVAFDANNVVPKISSNAGAAEQLHDGQAWGGLASYGKR